MSKKEKPLIFLGEASKVLSKIICSQLDSLGYQTLSFSDGLSLLKKVAEDSPSLIIASKELPVINGIDLCNILKNGSSKSSVPFILISSDEKVLDFWNGHVPANKVFAISSENIDQLMEAAQDFLSQVYIDPESLFDSDKDNSSAFDEKDGKLVSWIVNSMSQSDFFLNMTKNVINLYPYVKDTCLLVEKLFRLIYTACEYDVITLILDDQVTRIYSSGMEAFEPEVVQEFLRICKIEYEQQAKKNHTVTYEVTEIPGIPRKSGPNLEAYRAFVIKTGNDFVGTLHISSFKKKLFDYKVQSSIELILPAIANLLQESVLHAKLTVQDSKLRSAFSKFVPEQVINDFLNSDENTKLSESNEKRNVVILMSDIRNFTSISEINKPEDVVNFLNTYFTMMVDVVKKHGGTVDKFVGDGIMVLFGAPISYTDNARRAVEAAIEMYSLIPSIPTSNLKFPEDMNFDIGIGIHCGDVIVGQIGSADKTNYTVIGDTVNISSRLEGLTRVYDTRIIISKSVFDELGPLDESMHISVLDSVKVKGKKKSVLIYRVEGKMLPEEFTQAYEKGFKSYNEGAFNLAIPYFEKAEKCLPEDKAVKLMLQRCKEFLINKPENWDGAIALKSK